MFTDDEFSNMVMEIRSELTAYLRRLVVRPAIADELFQESVLRAWENRSESLPASELRPWLFRVASNLAIDYLRKHSTFRETVLTDAQRAAEGSPSWHATTASNRGSPELAAVAREHLVACFACTLRQFPPEQAAALLLKEVYGFTTAQIAEILDIRFAQVKHWIQQTRAAMQARYASSCALIAKQGVCYQCVELDGMYAANRGNPLAGTVGGIDDRLAVVQQLKASPASRWETLLAELLDDIGA